MDGPKHLAEYIDILNGRTLSPSPYRSAAADKVAMRDYFSSMEPIWLDEVTGLARSLPPLKPTIRVVALIPARNEEHRISNCLTAIASDVESSAAQDWFEILVMENGLHDELYRTRASVSGWIEAHRPEFTVNVISKEWASDEQAPLAKARKLLADVTIARALPTNMAAPLYLLSEDADIERVASCRLAAVVMLLDKNPNIDAVRGLQDRTMHALQANHLALLERRSWQMTELLLSARNMWPENNPEANFYWNRVVTAGSNVFITAQVYCQIHGYSTDVPVFEDMDIGQRISVLRGRRSGTRFVPHVSSIRHMPFREESNIARILHALSHASHVYEYDGSSSFYSIDHAIKRENAIEIYLKDLEAFSRVCSSNEQRFERVLADLSLEVNRIVDSQNDADRIMCRVLYTLGFRKEEYAILRGGGIAIRDWSRFANLAHLFSGRRDLSAR